jgi:hypothetical protein
MNQHDPKKVQTLFILWGAMTFSALLYLGLAFMINQSRTTNATVMSSLKDYLTGPLQYLPYALPILLGSLGLTLFSALLNKASGSNYFAKVQTAMIVMLAIFEVNVILGLVLFFIGTPFVKFIPFAVGTVALNLVGLQRIIVALSR